ncbi:MAG: tetratricopeptide repeat protein [Myxococcales bacterium]|nr:tetratricopeptide repeat protein [Myxococcales bacterium]
MIALTLVASLLAPAAGQPAAKPTIAQAKAAAAAWKQAVKAGRKAFTAQNYDAAAKHFQAAVDLDPNDAATLGELGWIQYKAGRLPAAEATLRRALLHVKAAKTEGMIRYNLGRVLEDQGKAVEAADAYRLSLARRPHKVVQARLDDLQGKLTPAGKATLDQICAQAMSDWNCGTGEDDLKCTCAAEKTLTSEAAATNGAPVTPAGGDTEFNQHVILRAALLAVKGEGMGSLDARHLAVETGSGGWQHVGLVVQGWSPGASYIHNSGTLKGFEFVDRLSTGEGELLVLRVNNVESDGDYGSNTIELDERDTLYLCHGNGGNPACFHLDTMRKRGVEVMIDGEPHEGELSSQGYTLDASVGHMAITVKAGQGEVPAEVKSGLGRVNYDKLGSTPGWQITPLR